MKTEILIGDQGSIAPVLKPIRSFDGWLCEYKKPQHPETRVGLLFSLNKAEFMDVERDALYRAAVFLMDVADGYSFSSYGIDQEERNPIPCMAFRVLINKFFKKGHREHSAIVWEFWRKVLTYDDGVLSKKIQWFFRPGNQIREERPFSNHPAPLDDRFKENNYQHEVVKEFMLQFVEVAFHTNNEGKTWLNASEFRPWLMDFLEYYGMILKFFIDRIGKTIPSFGANTLDEIMVQKLTEMALRRDVALPVRGLFGGTGVDYVYRKPQSLEEAVLGGSEAAIIVALHQIAKKEHDRLIPQ